MVTHTKKKESKIKLTKAFTLVQGKKKKEKKIEVIYLKGVFLIRIIINTDFFKERKRGDQ